MYHLFWLLLDLEWKVSDIKTGHKNEFKKNYHKMLHLKSDFYG